MAIHVPIVMCGLQLHGCFTRTTELFIIRLRVITSPIFVALHLLVSEIAKCIA